MNYYNEIKSELIKSEIYDRAKDYSKDRNKVKVYFKIGKLLNEAGKEYGKLMIEVGKKYNERNLRYMRKFYEIFHNSNWNPVGSNLTWTNIRITLSLKSINAIIYYITMSKKNNLTKRQLEEKIRNKEYERLLESTRNKLIYDEKIEVKDLNPNPILIRNKNNIEVVTEKILHYLILEDIENFLEELGKGFTFIKSEYPIKFESRYNYIDLLLYNIEFNCYVVIELKITELKKEHIGQIHIYMNYIDNNLKTINQNKTIGIIICKKDKQSLAKRNHLLKQQICFV